MTKRVVPRVFISSTFKDLEEHREAVYRALRKLGIEGDDMIYWSADERAPADYSADRVTQADVLILILAHRYGFIPPSDTRSVTQIEYETARTAKLSVLAFFLDESVPWPPGLVEWEQKDRLATFKDRVRKEVTPDTFKTPDELASQVTGAVVSFVERHRRQLAGKRRFATRTIRVSSRGQIERNADLTVEVGTAEDGLPLLLEIRRSPDLKADLEHLAGKVGDDLLRTFRAALEEDAKTSRLEQQIHKVEMRRGRRSRLLITESTLSELFRSTLSAILEQASRSGPDPTVVVPPKLSPRQPARREPEVSALDSRGQEREGTAAIALDPRVRKIQSVGGANRFLGLSLTDSRIYSVGRWLGEWVEWREFVCESLPANFPDARFQVADEGTWHPFSSYPETLFERGLAAESTEFSTGIVVRIARQDVGKLISDIADALGGLHGKNRIHGDLKPQNILLAEAGPVLIDLFDLRPGDTSPGFSPAWSAPEQILGEPVSPAADIYPLGRMLAGALGGRLVGEVRKFKTPYESHDLEEIDIFHNPSIFIVPGEEILDAEGIGEWLDLSRSCLRFRAAGRPQSAADFKSRVDSLLDGAPLPGYLELRLDTPLVAATLADGRDVVARRVRG